MNSKNFQIGGITFFSLLFLMFSCEDGKAPKGIRSNSSKIEFVSPKSGKKFIWGDTIHFNIGLKKQSDLAAEKISLYVNGVVVAESSGSILKFDYASETGTGGQVKVKAVVKFSNGSTARKRSGLKILSKEAPKKMNYQVVNTFPHDNDAYTQGLFYLNGVLYEGTGNYGKSLLREVNVETGEIIKEHALDSK
jgi:glutaminyl-peptide cyclotransferase